MNEQITTQTNVTTGDKRDNRSRYLTVLIVFLALGALAVALWSPVRQSLSPCGELDIALKLSGCTHLFELPNFAIEHLAVSPQGDRIAVLGYGRVDESSLENYPEIRILDTNSGEVLEVIRDDLNLPDGVPAPIFFTADGASVEAMSEQLPPLMGYSDVRLPDGETEVSYTTAESNPRFIVRRVSDGSIIREIPTNVSALSSALYVSPDGRRLAARFMYPSVRAAWDLESGERLINLTTWEDIYPALALGWLTDHRTMVIGITHRGRYDSGLAFFDTGE